MSQRLLLILLWATFCISYSKSTLVDIALKKNGRESELKSKINMDDKHYNYKKGRQLYVLLNEEPLYMFKIYQALYHNTSRSLIRNYSSIRSFVGHNFSRGLNNLTLAFAVVKDFMPPNRGNFELVLRIHDLKYLKKRCLPDFCRINLFYSNERDVRLIYNETLDEKRNIGTGESYYDDFIQIEFPPDFKTFFPHYSYINQTLITLQFIISMDMLFPNGTTKAILSDDMTENIFFFNKTEYETSDPVLIQYSANDGEHKVSKHQKMNFGSWGGMSNPCFLRSYHVGLLDLHKMFSATVITPMDYDLAYCSGYCSSDAPLFDLNINSTLNHLNESLSNVFGNATCQPSSYTPIYMKFLDGDHFIIELVEDLIIASCECY